MKFDIRVQERYLRDGLLSKKDFEKFIKDLPDESKNAEESNPFAKDPEIELNSDGIDSEAVENLGKHSKTAPTFSF